jgi:hypothetical protein
MACVKASSVHARFPPTYWADKHVYMDSSSVECFDWWIIGLKGPWRKRSPWRYCPAFVWIDWGRLWWCLGGYSLFSPTFESGICRWGRVITSNNNNRFLKNSSGSHMCILQFLDFKTFISSLLTVLSSCKILHHTLWADTRSIDFHDYILYFMPPKAQQ